MEVCEHKNFSKLKQFIIDSGIDDIKIGFTDINGVIRGKYVCLDSFFTGLDEGISFCDVIMGWDIEDQIYENCSFTGSHTGFPDLKLKILPETWRHDFLDQKTLFFLTKISGKGEFICPRSLLERVVAQCKSMDLEAYAGVEYEFFLFDETPQSLREKQFRNLKPISPGSQGYSILQTSLASDFCHEILALGRKMRFPMKALHTEVGPGVWEAPLEVANILEAADRASLFKTFVKILAHKHNRIATFMAKWSEKMPGQSGHLHLSLRRNDGSYAFYDSSKPQGLSDLLYSFIAGQLYLLPELFVMYAPTINSYSRFVPGFWAPTNISWGIEKRTAAIRVIPGSPNSQRVECRVPGADSNPYLALAAALASGLWGIQQKLKLTEAVEKNLYNKNFPKTLTEAIANFKNSKIANELFGEQFVEHFSTSREWEVQQFNSHVTDWELSRYFESI